LSVIQQWLRGNAAVAASELGEFASNPELPDPLRPLLAALGAIVAGSRNPSVAENPELPYTSAAELLLLIETLAAQERIDGAQPQQH
jgi:hypothetical protein